MDRWITPINACAYLPFNTTTQIILKKVSNSHFSHTTPHAKSNQVPMNIWLSSASSTSTLLHVSNSWNTWLLQLTIRTCFLENNKHHRMTVSSPMHARISISTRAFYEPSGLLSHHGGFWLTCQGRVEAICERGFNTKLFPEGKRNCQYPIMHVLAVPQVDQNKIIYCFCESFDTEAASSI